MFKGRIVQNAGFRRPFELSAFLKQAFEHRIMS